MRSVISWRLPFGEGGSEGRRSRAAKYQPMGRDCKRHISENEVVSQILQIWWGRARWLFMFVECGATFGCLEFVVLFVVVFFENVGLSGFTPVRA